MKLVKNIFTVSFFAIMVVAGARAEIVSTTLLEEKLPTVNNATLTIQQNGTPVGTFTANSATDNTVNITVPTGSLASKDTISDADVATGAINQDKIKNLTADLGKKEDTENKATKNYTSGSTTEYPSIKVAEDIAKIAAGAAVGNYALKTELEEEADVRGQADAALGKRIDEHVKTAVQTVAPTEATAGKYVTNFTKSGTTVTATTAYVQIPVGSATAPTSVASIWIE